MMSNCGYYSCFKRVPKCNHPEKGEYKSKRLREGACSRWHPCEMCKRECGGIYPSQLTKANLSNCEIDIVDKDGSVIKGGVSCGFNS